MMMIQQNGKHLDAQIASLVDISVMTSVSTDPCAF